jgi:hypothetical protein
MTTPDDQPWTEEEIEARANDLPVYVPPLPGIGEISQDPHLFDEQPAAGRFGAKARAAIVSGTAGAMVAAMVAFLGMGEHPADSNHNDITVEYSRNVAPSPIGDGPWCDMAISVAADRSGNIVAVCGGPRRGFAYTPAHANDFARRGLWHVGIKDIQVGDVVFFRWSKKKNAGPGDVEHVGIVEHVYDDGTIATDEGNIGNRCARFHRDGTYVVGYGRPPYVGADDVAMVVSLGVRA